MLWCCYSRDEVKVMLAKSTGLSGDSVGSFSKLFRATAKSFEQDAQRMSRQLMPGITKANPKRINGR